MDFLGPDVTPKSTLRAPIDGVVLDYSVAEGEVFAPESGLLSIANPSTVWVLADVYEKDLGSIFPGQRVEVFSGAYPGRAFRGKLSYVSHVFNPETRTVKVRGEAPVKPRTRPAGSSWTCSLP